MAEPGRHQAADEIMNWFVSLSLANDERILPAVRGVAAAAARQASFESAEVERIACAVAGAAQVAMLASRGHGPTIDLWFELRARQFEVRLKYLDAGPAPRAAIDGGGMETVEFSREGRYTVCCLVRTLP